METYAAMVERESLPKPTTHIAKPKVTEHQGNWYKRIERHWHIKLPNAGTRNGDAENDKGQALKSLKHHHHWPYSQLNLREVLSDDIGAQFVCRFFLDC